MMPEHFRKFVDYEIGTGIITGAHDQIVSAKENAYRLKDSIANSQLIEQKNTGHEIRKRIRKPLVLR